MPLVFYSVKFWVRILVYGSLLTALIVTGLQAFQNRGDFNGFDISNSSIPTTEILSGGPPRDGIPAIDQPSFDLAAKHDDLKPDSRVLGVVVNGQARAYPVAILNWHEIVNDQIDDQAVTLTYCPLCGTGMAFIAPVSENTKGFGVSGLLYNSDVLLYDRSTESLWSQILMTAVSGPRQGETLKPLAVEHTDWQDWQNRYPDSLVLNRDTGFWRDYDKSPYVGYDTDDSLFFPVANRDNRYPAKSQVIGLVIEGQQKAWPISELKQAGETVADSLAGQALQVSYDPEGDRAWITDIDGQLLPATRGYWFAWMAFYPDSAVYTN